MATAALAIVAANSSFAPLYNEVLHVLFLGHSLTHWVNDALMALFFFLVGLEIKRELLTGNLSSWPQRLLPGIAALGGMIIPALIYAITNRNSPETLHGWAIPAATDIAFALGILALVPRVPLSLKVFLTALAILDDLGAILLIAIFYSGGLNPVPLLLEGILIAALITFNRSGVTNIVPYLGTGILLWLCTYQSGLHATIAGVILALTIPTKSLPKTEHALQPWVAYTVLPIFAFCNAGVSFSGITLASFAHPVTLGIFLGLLVGKQLGVGAAMWASIRLLKIPAPHGTSVAQLYATTLLCGIGFTMSLFIGNLALPVDMAPQIRLGILAASVTAALLALAILSLTKRS